MADLENEEIIEGPKVSHPTGLELVFSPTHPILNDLLFLSSDLVYSVLLLRFPSAEGIFSF